MIETKSNGDTRGYRLPTLRIVDLLTTQVQSVRIELVGNPSSTVTRLGTVLLYVPFLLVGYLLLLTALMNVFAAGLGWALTCLLFGAAHVVGGVVGIKHGRSIGAAKKYEVLEPALGPAQTPAPTSVDDTAPALPLPFARQVATATLGPRPGALISEKAQAARPR